MTTSTLFILILKLVTCALGGQFQYAFRGTIFTSEEIVINKDASTVKFLVSGSLAGWFESLLQRYEDFQTNEIDTKIWNVFSGSEAASKTPTTNGNFYVQFRYNSMATVFNMGADNLIGLREDAIKIHNQNRAKHGVNNLEQYPDLNITAQLYANKIAAKRKEYPCYPSPVVTDSVGMVYCLEDDEKAIASEVLKSIQNWYTLEKDQYKNEIKDLTKNIMEECRRFVAMVWKDTTQMGIGVSYRKEIYENNPRMEVYISVHYHDGDHRWIHSLLLDNVKSEVR